MVAKRGEDKELRDGRLFSGDLPSIVAAAHELKAPLALIRQLALGLESSGAREENVGRIVLTAEKGLRLSSDLTKSLRLQDALFETEPINPLSLCKDVVHEMSPLFNAHNKKLVVAERKRQLLVVGNNSLLRRVITNFSDNALHYAESDKPVEISVRAVEGGEKVRLGVRDFGPAIPSNIWNNLVDKLTNSPQSVNARPQSSGLGLYIASQFAEAMGGEIGAVRHRDGATFYIDLQASKQTSLL
jgi:signal transduction histidine kinase